MSFSKPLTSFFNDVKICVASYFMYGVSHKGKYCIFNKILVRKAQISVESYLVYQSVSQVNFMWCVFHNVQWYWSDNLCKLVTDQWRGSLGGRDSEICWFTEEIGTYMRCWEKPGDLPLAKRHKMEEHTVFPKNVCKNLLHKSCTSLPLQPRPPEALGINGAKSCILTISWH